MGLSRIPPPSPHIVQFYSDDEVFVDEICLVLSRALTQGQSTIVIATPEHREKITSKLEGQLSNFRKAVADGRYIALDAAETLSCFMVDGMPDPQRFADILGRVISRAASIAEEGPATVVAFGEMVAVLRAQVNEAAALSI